MVGAHSQDVVGLLGALRDTLLVSWISRGIYQALRNLVQPRNGQDAKIGVPPYPQVPRFLGEYREAAQIGVRR